MLSSNRIRNPKQSVYELGTVVRDHTNMDRLAFLTAERTGGFASDTLGRIQTFLRDIDAENVVIEALPCERRPMACRPRPLRVLLDGEWKLVALERNDPTISGII